MNPLESLAAYAGSWRGSSGLKLSADSPPDVTPSTMTVTPLLAGRFVRVDYTWSHEGRPQEGSILLGRTKATGALTAHWIDSFHNGDRVMPCEGPAPTDATLTVRGTYPAPPGPDWGWRIDVVPAVAKLGIVMYNVHPESLGGAEELAVTAEYERAA